LALTESAASETAGRHWRDDAGILLTLAGLSLAAWGLVIWSIVHMDAPVVSLMMPMMSAWTLPEAAAVWLMWAVMMAAMMLPSAAPVIVAHRRVARLRCGEGSRESRYFVTGYLLAWSAFSLAAAALQWGLQGLGVLSHMLVVTQAWLAGGILVAAGLYQLRPAKVACLQQCRSPVGFLLTEWRSGRAGALRMGLHHGAYCVGCCWALMAVLFVFGVMNLLAIAVLSTAVAAEKLLPQGRRAAQGLAILLIAWGLILPFV
jgi:predicted metal-binding membrane protein